MNKKNQKNTTVEAPEMVVTATEAPAVDAAPKKRTSRSRKKVVAPVEKEEIKNVETPTTESPVVENITDTAPSASTAEEAPKTEEKSQQQVVEKPQQQTEKSQQQVEKPQLQPEKPQQQIEKPQQPKPLVKPAPKMPNNLIIKDFCDLANNGSRIPLLNDQQIQQLTYEDATERYMIMEAILANVLDYDIVLSDTNIWLELLVGHTSSHSDPRVNARLQFERQLEFISKMMKRIGGKFMIMSETYEEVDRFATMQEPTDYKVADWKDEVLCRNVAARLAKRLMLSQQKENRLRIEGIGSESHHAAFADPAIIRRTVELFAQGKKVLLLTNDASVGIRSLGMCDDLQRTNEIDDKTWRSIYEPQRPMVLTMDDLKLLDQFTRQYHFLMVAAGQSWMQDVNMREGITLDKPLKLWQEGFRPGDRHERRSDRIEQQRREQEKAEQQRREQEKRERAEQEKREKAERAEQEKRERAEQQRLEQQRREEQRKADRERAAAEKARKAAEQQAAQTAAPAEEPAPTPSEEPTAPAPTVVEQPAADIIADDNNATVAPEAEETPLAPSGSFGATAEMMDLIAPQQGDKKPRTRRGGRRRSSGKKNNSENE